MMDNTNYTSHSISSGHIKKQFESDLENISVINQTNFHKPTMVSFQKLNERTINKSELEKVMDANAMLSSQLYHLTSERNELLTQLDTYANDISALENQVDNANNEIGVLRQENEALHLEGREYQSHINILQSENNNLNNKLNQSAMRNNQLTQTIVDYQKQIEGMQNDIQSIQSQTIQFDTLSNEFVKLKNRYRSLMKSTPNGSNISIEVLQKENQKLRKNLELFYKENHAAAIKINELEGQIQKMNNHNNDISNSNTNDKKEGSGENVLLHRMVNSLNKKIEALQIEIYSLKRTRRAKTIDHYKSFN